MYGNIIEKHLVSINCNIKSLNRAHYVTLLNNTFGDRTKQLIMVTMKQIVKSAIKDKLLSASVFNKIFVDLIKVKYTLKDKRPLTENEKEAIKKLTFLPEKKSLFIYCMGVV